jgi:predicted choloylglycine hydrolase
MTFSFRAPSVGRNETNTQTITEWKKEERKMQIKKLWVCILMALFVVASAASVTPATTASTDQSWRLIGTFDQASLKKNVETGTLLLHLKGTPFQMGYQQGMLLSGMITNLYSGFLTPLCMEVGGSFTQVGFTQGYAILNSTAWEAMVPSIMGYTPQYWAEMKGLAAGLKASGSPVSFDDILIAQTFLDITSLVSSGRNPLNYGCSNFAAWGDATPTGELIHGRNLDFWTFNIAPNCSIVSVYEPEYDPTIPGYTPGYPFLSVGWAGIIGSLSGMNTAGISVGETTCDTVNNTIVGVPFMLLLRSVIQYSDSIPAAYWILSNTPRTTGFSILVGDGKVPDAKVIEISATNTAIRSVNPYQPTPPQTIHTSNEFDCKSMIAGQAAAYGVNWSPDKNTTLQWYSAVSTFDRRFIRYNQLLRTYYGQITVGTAETILRDRYDLFQNRYLSYSEYGNTINALGPRTQVTGPIPQYYGIVRPIILQSCTMHSWVFLPGRLQAWIAQGQYPAPRGKYVLVDLKTELEGRIPQPELTHYYTSTIGYGASKLKVAHVFGGPWQRGWQLGFLLADEIYNLTKVAYSLGSPIPPEVFKPFLQGLASYWGYFVPLEFRIEMAAIAAGASARGYNITYEDILVFNSMVDISYWLQVHSDSLSCTCLLATKSATKDGDTIIGTTIDSWRQVRPYMVLVDVDPTIGYRCIYLSGAGCLGLNGMNEMSLGQVEQSIGGWGQKFGMPMMVQSRMILQYCKTIYEAKTFIEWSSTTINPLLGMNYLSHVHCIEVSDREGNIMVMEMSPSYVSPSYGELPSKVCTIINPNNGIDNQPPGWTFIGQGVNWLSRQGIFCCHDMKVYQFDPTDWADAKMYRMSQLANASWGQLTIPKVLSFTKDATIYDPDQVGSIWMLPRDGLVYALQGPAANGTYAVTYIPLK